MNTHILLEAMNFILLLILSVVLTIKIRTIKDKHRLHGILSMISWFYHALIFYSVLLLDELFIPGMKLWLYNRGFHIDVWGSLIVMHIVIALGLKEYLKINYINDMETK